MNFQRKPLSGLGMRSAENSLSLAGGEGYFGSVWVLGRSLLFACDVARYASVCCTKTITELKQ